MTIPSIQTAFNAGELSPAIYGRVDLAKYRLGTATCRNFFASYRGGATTRAGTKFVGVCRQGNKGQANNVPPPRDITFQFSVTQGITIEAGQNYFRFITNGAYITESPTTITGITRAAPGVVTDPLHGYSNGDEVFISGVAGMIQINNRSFEVAAVTTNTYTLVDPLSGQSVSTAGYSPYSSGGTAARIYTLATPYAASDLSLLKWAQSADVMSFTHPSYAPHDLDRITSTNWLLTKTTFGARISAPATISLSETDSGISTKSFYYQFVATAIDQTTGEESVASPVGTVLAVDIAAEAATITIDCAGVSGASSYNFYGAPATFKNPPSGGALFGFLGQAFGPSFSDTNIVANFAKSPPLHKNPFATSSLISVQMTAQGSGYNPTTTTATVLSPIGKNPVLTPVVINGGIAWTVVDNGGEGMTGGEAISFSDTSTGGKATGSIDFQGSGNPADGDTVTLNGVTWTFKTVVVGADQTQIGPTLALTLAALAGDLGASGNASLTVASYSATATQLQIVYNTPGAGGNAYTLAASVATPSGPHLTGGGGGGSGASATLTIGRATGTYPSVVAYFQQRRVYANTLNAPDTYFASQPGAFTNMDSSIPVSDSDAIIGTPWSQQVNGIQWMMNMPGGLVIFTGLGAWQLSGAGSGLSTSAALTPSNQVANPQAYNGCSPLVPPIAINYDILYVQEKGSIVRDLSYNFFVNIYTGTDLTVLSNHLFDGFTIVQWCWAEEPNKLLWLVRNDGALLCLTYLKEQDVYAWTRHDTNGLFQSACSVSEPPVNAPYFIVKRLIQNDGVPVWSYFQERMDNRQWATQEQAWCVDAGLTYPLNQPAASLSVSSADGVPTLQQPVLVFGGSNYSSSTFAVIDDPTGSGALAAITLSGGVVTTASVSGVLTGYTNPKFVVRDPTGVGGGVAINIAIESLTTITASAGVFANTPGFGEAGDIVRMGDRQMEVQTFLSPTSLAAIVLQDHENEIPNDPLNTPIPTPAGMWSIAAPVTTVYGLNHLEGMLVSILADGVVVEPQIVANGSVTLPSPATMITVGLGFTAQLQTLYLDIPGGPTVQGRRKEIDQVIIRVANSGLPFDIGTNQPDAAAQPNQQTVPWTNLSGIQGEVSGSKTPLQPYDLQTGDFWSNAFDELGLTNGQVAIQQDRPLPLSILAVIPWTRVYDDVGP